MARNRAPALALENVSLRVRDGASERTLLLAPALHLPPGSVLGVRGASGAGKSTFLRILSGVVPPTSGSVRWGDVRLETLSEAERDRWRGERCGFLFQDFRLFPDLTAEENVLLPVTFTRAITARDRAKARELLTEHGVRPQSRAATLSRGEMQRTALARVLLAEPGVILADEPTASLDGARAESVTRRLLSAAEGLGATLILVSHDPRVLAAMPHVAEIDCGRLIVPDELSEPAETAEPAAVIPKRPCMPGASGPASRSSARETRSCM